MKDLLDVVTIFHYFYSHALPYSGRASENVTNRALLANVVPQWNGIEAKIKKLK